MKKCYLVFDQLPSILDGGLIATYIQMVPFLEKRYDVHIISIFNCSEAVKSENVFEGYCLHVMNNTVIDNRFFRMFSYLKKSEVNKAIFALLSMMIYFFSAPFIRLKMRKLVSNDDVVIVSSPAAAMFMSRKNSFILDIHTDFDYFFGHQLIGRLQTLLMRKPKLTVFRNGLDAQKGSKHFESDFIYHYVPQHNSSENKLNMSDKKRIIFLGRLHEHKNPMRLLDCAGQLKERYHSFELDMYGTGPLETEIRQRISEMGLQNHVFLKGFLSDKKKIADYDVMWLTSNLEGFGLVLIEAKANHVPAVSVEWGKAVYEVIRNETDGYVAKTDEEFVNFTCELFEDEELLAEFSEEAYQDYLERFSEESYKEKLFSLLDAYEIDVHEGRKMK